MGRKAEEQVRFEFFDQVREALCPLIFEAKIGSELILFEVKDHIAYPPSKFVFRVLFTRSGFFAQKE